MAETTNIEWCDATFNPWIGCTEVSPACDHCYARDFMTKKPRWATAWSGDRFRTSVDYWRQPLKWNREAERSGIRRKVFCASLADVFDNKVPAEWRIELFRLIGITPHLDWLLLTKRPQNISKMLPSDYVLAGKPPHNVWLGTTVENQEEADRRIPHLLAVPAKVHFLSCEPLLGPVDLRHVAQTDDGYINSLSSSTGPNIDWVIAGSESGRHARPTDRDWVRGIRDQCVDAKASFFWKQDVIKGKKYPLPELDGKQWAELPL